MAAIEKTVVVTGATSGLGQAAAVDFAKDGARVIIVGRDAARAAATIKKAEAAGGHVISIIGDLSSRAGVQAIAEAIRAQTDRLDVLVNNAGGMFKTQQSSDDGVEMTFALNTLGAFLLEHALHPLLAAAKGRVVNVATGMLDHFPVKVDELVSPKRYSGFNQYGRAKLASVMMTVEQAKRFETDGVSAVSLHPGIVLGTRFGGGQSKAFQRTVGSLLRLIGMARPLEASVKDYQTACFGEIQNGAYVIKGAKAKLPKQAEDDAVRAKIMSLLDRLSAAV